MDVGEGTLVHDTNEMTNEKYAVTMANVFFSVKNKWTIQITTIKYYAGLLAVQNCTANSKIR